MYRFPIVFVFASLLFGCATQPVGTSGAEGIDCSRTEQTGCLELDMLNIEHDEEHPLMESIIPQYWKKEGNEEIRRHLALDLGPDLFDCFRNDRCDPAPGKTVFTVYVWNANEGVSVEQMAAYETKNRRADPRSISFREINPDSFRGEFAPENDLGMPNRAFRLSTNEAVGAFQFPWELVNEDTYILVCASNIQRGTESVVYPPVANRQYQGLWLNPEYLQDVRHYEYILMPHTVVRR